MRFHVVSLPHTQTTAAYSACAYTQKVRKFCKMMLARGHYVALYAGEQNDAPCSEHVVCIGEAERARAVGAQHYTSPTWDAAAPHWQTFNGNVIARLRETAQPHDFVCVIGGRAHKPIADALPHLRVVEFGIGYGGTFSPFRVWESYAWMHAVYGAQAADPHAANGHWFDAVIPNYFDLTEFPFSAVKDDYFLFMGRLIERKGHCVATDVCKRLGKRLVIAGQGSPPDYGEYVGVVGAEERGRLMSRATAVFVPTVYVEPFGGVAVEAMLCGTPVITTDWGAFTETVVNGLNGFRCRTFADFERAALAAPYLYPTTIREHAAVRYALEPVAKLYEEYFTRLSSLWGDGWYARAS